MHSLGTALLQVDIQGADLIGVDLMKLINRGGFLMFIISDYPVLTIDMRCAKSGANH